MRVCVMSSVMSGCGKTAMAVHKAKVKPARQYWRALSGGRRKMDLFYMYVCYTNLNQVALRSAKANVL